MRNVGKKVVYSLLEEGYDLGELLAIYHIAKKEKNMSEEEITKEYLISKIEKQNKDQNPVIDRETYYRYYNKRHDFIHPTLGIVYPISKIDSEGKVSVFYGKRSIERVHYETLKPVEIPSTIHRLMFQAIIPKYYSKSGNISRESIYDIIRIYGEDPEFLAKVGILLSPLYDKDTLEKKDKEYCKERISEITDMLTDKAKNITEELKDGFLNLKDEISQDENIKKIRKSFEININDSLFNEPKFISVDGSLSQKEVNKFVEKFGEDLALLEIMGIIPNPNYIDPNQNNNGYKK